VTVNANEQERRRQARLDIARSRRLREDPQRAKSYALNDPRGPAKEIGLFAEIEFIPATGRSAVHKQQEENDERY
jgi:hypothetical protein